MTSSGSNAAPQGYFAPVWERFHPRLRWQIHHCNPDQTSTKGPRHPAVQRPPKTSAVGAGVASDEARPDTLTDQLSPQPLPPEETPRPTPIPLNHPDQCGSGFIRDWPQSGHKTRAPNLPDKPGTLDLMADTRCRAENSHRATPRSLWERACRGAEPSRRAAKRPQNHPLQCLRQGKLLHANHTRNAPPTTLRKTAREGADTAIPVTPIAPRNPYTVSALAAPSPVASPERKPRFRQRCTQSNPIGPTGAAIENPITSDLTNNMILSRQYPFGEGKMVDVRSIAQNALSKEYSSFT